MIFVKLYSGTMFSKFQVSIKRGRTSSGSERWRKEGELCHQLQERNKRKLSDYILELFSETISIKRGRRASDSER